MRVESSPSCSGIERSQVVNGELGLDAWLLSEPVLQVLVVALFDDDVWLEDLMLSASLHLFKNRWDLVGEVERVPAIVPWTVLE